ncbi:uncharacterized protein METZ01_LOCUS491579, partial [marine metagenome]
QAHPLYRNCRAIHVIVLVCSA